MINPVDGQAVDGQIVQLEGEAVEENRFAEKIQDLKEVIPQKAGRILLSLLFVLELHTSLLPL